MPKASSRRGQEKTELNAPTIRKSPRRGQKKTGLNAPYMKTRHGNMAHVALICKIFEKRLLESDNDAYARKVTPWTDWEEQLTHEEKRGYHDALPQAMAAAKKFVKAHKYKICGAAWNDLEQWMETKKFFDCGK